MKTDLEIQKDVMAELQWQPFLHAAEIGVSVKNGIVTLTGQVDSYAKKLEAEQAAKKVFGVKAVAEEIQVGLSPAYRKNDTEIAAAVLHALKWHTAIPDDRVQVKVEDGFVKLEGEVEWAFERDSATNAVKYLTGVRSVSNLITIKPKVTVHELEKKIRAAFHRSATVDAEKITVTVEGNKATLTGKVRSFAEKREAENAVWAGPGIFSLDSKLVVEEPELVY